MLDFKIKPLDNITFDLKELVDYYQELKTNYQHLKWTPALDMGNIYSWAMHTNLADTTIPVPPYNLPKDWILESQRTVNNSRFNTPTELIFGFAEKLQKVFPFSKHCVVITHGPGFNVPAHIDDVEGQDEEHVKIHVPIESNDQSYFEVDNEQYVLSTGKFYLVNTMRMHSTNNKGSTDRSHLIFKIPLSQVDNIINNKIVI